MSNLVNGFTGRGEPIVVEIPAVVPHKRLTDSQRAHVRALIAREHRGTEPEILALNRVIAKTSIDLTKLRGLRSNDDGPDLAHLAEIRLENLCAYRAEISPVDS